MRKRKSGARVGFSNERFLAQMAELTGVTPEGAYGRLTPLVLTDLEAARGSLLLRELYSKYDDFQKSPEKENTTWEKFHLAELICKETNSTFPRRFNTDPFWREVYHRIARVLKVFSWDECHRGMDFGPGATTRLPRRSASAAYKYSGIPESTLGNAVLATCAIRMEPLWIQSVGIDPKAPNDLVKVVPGNCVIVVPKNYKTDRTIAKEPDMNIYVQKGIGSVLRRRLKSVGVNLNDQTANQRAAREGSELGLLATIDLSMASDTLAYMVVSYLLPNDWWWALEQSRSPVGVLPSGDHVVYQKFSSMGNGYTFELETLIFWAIAQCVCSPSPSEVDSRILVYGDDIVVPSDKAEAVMERLREAGFTPNPDKTFHQGPYRESCGKHYFLGYDITPFYVRRPVAALDRLFLVHNNVYRWGDRTGVDSTSVLTGLKGLAPAKWREPRLPDGYGDGAFIGAVDQLRLDSHPHGWDSWQVEALQVSQDLLQDDLPMGQLIASLKQLTSDVKTSFLAGIAPNQRETLQPDLREHNSGLPVRGGQYRQMTLQIPRRSLAS